MSNLISKFKRELSYKSRMSVQQPLSTDLKVDRQTWGKAQLWLIAMKNLWVLGPSRMGYLYVPAEKLKRQLKNAKLTKKLFKSHLKSYLASDLPRGNEKWATYIRCRRSFWKLRKLESHEINGNDVHYCCDCPVYLQYAICKHSLGLSILREHTEVPLNYRISAEENG
mmetsp:Transcript_9028/g.11846  ORF Transcript_9028/g.11846 Transcript_9028/m.11846 type:complete len:168 (+) Transcript_9028:332-835(+)